MPPLQLIDEELDVLRTLAEPIDHRRRPEFLREVAATLEQTRGRGASRGARGAASLLSRAEVTDQHFRHDLVDGDPNHMIPCVCECLIKIRWSFARGTFFLARRRLTDIGDRRRFVADFSRRVMTRRTVVEDQLGLSPNLCSAATA
jgi:hypothetical protein